MMRPQIAGMDVSRETLEQLEQYHRLLRKWTPAINLVAKSTMEDVWDRHFVDSAQVFGLVPRHEALWVDLGSGGGFPGLVCAVLARELSPETRFVLVESDMRKATFLRTVARELALEAEVICDRVEKVPPLGAEILSARALAPLPKLLDYAARHLGPAGIAVFLKGESFREEICKAQDDWRFAYEEIRSQTDEAAMILRIGDIERV
ncbi:16S rRNA (guanine(527)-N(7))-methyltransferase RsmG [Celeribacter indicus]|uniref:Ribosomal RNA small subunit methyltransferase G n=1 Tax=Celeribacter indicus TaxID=1208324 RepID=A0A0B5DXD9_9RHOB|nr:16S rRNA (guanine(527)-N(7))-methyltransferase RsmG [Celeribacter indicus]AJE44927.1 16S rRNA methyltransferase GidB [Celeribacter indicus]SDW97071.1 16S rRNA m(7)G-527 methyltransferase [Celeribacter indicus]